MLLDDELLIVCETWRYREQIEQEAAYHFGRLNQQLRAIEAPNGLIAMAEQARDDEIEHARLCRQIVRRLQGGAVFQPLQPRTNTDMGPPAGASLSVAQTALYCSLALACVTETLSAALLIEMRRLSDDKQIHATIQRILKDEIQHARIGWAHLAWEADRSDVRWVGECVPGMICASLRSEREGIKHFPPAAEKFGVLSPQSSREIMTASFTEVVFPGLELHGIDTFPARNTLARHRPPDSAI